MKNTYKRLVIRPFGFLLFLLAMMLPGLSFAQSITISPNADQDFGRVDVGSTSAPKLFNVTTSGVTRSVIVSFSGNPVTGAAPSFEGSTDDITYSTTLQLPPAGGTLYIRFKPTVVGATNDEIVELIRGSAYASLNLSGTGKAGVLFVSPSSLSFTPSVQVGQSSGAQSFSVRGEDLQGDVTITPPNGFQIRKGTDLFSSNPIVLPATNSALASTLIDVRFSPFTAGSYTNAPVVITSRNAGTQNVMLSGNATAAPAGATINIDPSTISFGTVTNSGSAKTEVFQVNATGINDNLVLTPNSPNILIRNASAGGAFQNTALSISPTNGVVVTTNIEVQLTGTVPQGAYSKTISITSPSTTPTPPAVKTVTVEADNTSGAISDISLVDPVATGTDYTFVTRPTTTSDPKTILVSGTNLLQKLVVEPIGVNARFFEVSADGVAYSSRLELEPGSNGNVQQKTIYIRFVPGTAATTKTAAIRATSAPASFKEVSVTGISEPTVRLNGSLGFFANNIVKNTVSEVKDIRVDGFLLGGTSVDLRFPKEVNNSGVATDAQYEFSVDGGTTYVKDITLPLDQNGNFSRQLKVRFAPQRVGSAVQNFEYRNVSFNNGSFFSGFGIDGQASAFAIAVEPTAQSTASIVRSADGTTATITFALTNAPAGLEYGRNRLVIGTSTYAKLPVSLFPADKQNFNPGTTDDDSYYQFGTGTRLDAGTSGSNTFVVFSGGSDKFTVSNLNPNLAYYFYSFEFNDDGVLNAENYRVPNNQPLTPLPVELVSFTAQLRNSQVQLNWTTASEKNNRGFEVQRSANGEQFSTVLYKEGRGTTAARTNYEAVDSKPMPGLSYYRLKQIDTDGKVSFTPPVAIKNASLIEATFYPNPTNGPLTISLPQARTESAVRVSISDLMGRVVKEQTLSSAGEVDLSQLNAGTYIVTVGEGTQKITRKVVKY